MEIIYTETLPTKEQLVALYSDAGWSGYTQFPEQLVLSCAHSQDLISAWHNENLVGLIRSVGDKHTILYVQDIIVLSTYRRHGIGSELLGKLLKKYPTIRQTVLITDSNSSAEKFYENVGLKKCEQLGISCYISLKS